MQLIVLISEANLPKLVPNYKGDLSKSGRRLPAAIAVVARETPMCAKVVTIPYLLKG